MPELPAELAAGIDRVLAGHRSVELRRSATRLSERYRVDQPAHTPILTGASAVAGYLSTRMPATYAAVRAALSRAATADPELAPVHVLDIGGGTGAATWAARSVFDSVRSTQLVDVSPAALEMGRTLLSGSEIDVTTAQERIGGHTTARLADLGIAAYLLGELTEPDRDRAVALLASSAPVVTVVEPGTTAGFGRLLRARDQLVASGRRILAPCPHEDACPLAGPSRDWCHLAVRLPRTATHRAVKGGELGYEDEKYCYVVAGPRSPTTRVGTILRHPQFRGGHVKLTVCTPEHIVEDVTVAKRSRATYRAARHCAWGDAWPPPAPPRFERESPT